MGGKLTYQTGWEESYPALLKVGLAANIFGPKNALRPLWGHKVTALLDVDHEVSRSSYIPSLAHLGLEWKPINLLALRVGIDQDVVGVNEVANNLTAGVGVFYGDFRFDYAFHEFFGAPGISNHFFSLSYGIGPGKRSKEQIVATPDQIITTEAQLQVKGVAIDPAIKKVSINNISVGLNPRGEFQAYTPLKVNKNVIAIKGLDQQNKLLAKKTLRALRLVTYPDVPASYWASGQISYVGSLGIIKGYPDGNFKPQGTITRAELSALLIRTKMGGDANVPRAEQKIFKDVPMSHWASKYVNLAVKSGIVKGYPDGSFKSNARVNRAEGLAMIARFGGVKEVAFTNEFADITPDHWAANIIAGAYDKGILAYLQGKPFRPNLALTRAEAVEMLYRTGPINLLIENMLDFNKGYETK